MPALKPSHKAIQTYYAALQAFTDQHVSHETAVRSAFQNLLAETGRAHGWTLIPELGMPVGKRTVIPDGTLRDEYYLPRGYWEAKDTHDDLDDEIRKKAARGYPLSNIIFEDTRQAVLYQDKREALRADLTDPRALADLLNQFLGYAAPDIESFEQAVSEFKERVPELARGLDEKIKQAHKDNPRFQAAYEAFFELCKTALNPNISRAAVDEMLVQHLLTERLIRKIFDNPEFTRRNVIAVEVEKVIDALVSRSFNRDDFLKSLDRFYRAIEDAAHDLQDFSEKQHFLNSIYERFFQGYSVKLADTHGIVYTPQPIVDFMCASVVEVLHTEFGKDLSDPDVVILDPCTGTGNFIVNLLHRAARHDLEALYKNRLFANEIMLLPYYIASLNIEHAYYELTDCYEAFEGLCFVDTLDIAEGAQMRMSFMSEANSARVARQKQAPITVIIGNPPYNVGQVNENDNNKNRKYDVIDERVAATYSRASKATSRSKLNDPYVKFFRWASDRLQGRDGIVCMVTNNSFVDQIAFDGMRQHLLQDFTGIYHVDLHGNVRKNPKLSGTTHNVFGIQVGVGITIAVRSRAHTDRQLSYYRVPEDWRKEQKLAWLAEQLTPNPQPLPPQAREGARDIESPSSQMPQAREGARDIESPSSRMPRAGEGEQDKEWSAARWQTEGKLWDKLKPLAREKRSQPTPAEDALWQQIRRNQLGPKFRRQFTIERFIVDFYSSDAKMVIEVDGDIHQYTILEDEIRQRFLEDQGLRVLRFSNAEVLGNIDQVLQRIQSVLRPSSAPSANAHAPSPASGGRGRGLGVSPLRHVSWRSLEPDSHNTWLVPDYADAFAALLPIGSKTAKAPSGLDAKAIFRSFSLGVATHRDAIVYDFDRPRLIERMKQFIEGYNVEVDRYRRFSGKPDIFVYNPHIVWDRDLKEDLERGKYAEYHELKIRPSLYRPYCARHLFFDRMLNAEIYSVQQLFPKLDAENRVIALTRLGSEKPFMTLMTNTLSDLHLVGAGSGSQCFPFYVYDADGSNRRENITDWALAQFRDHYGDPSISKWDIFYYVYGVLHHPGYREKFADNLKRELPRIPFAPDFRVFAEVGHKLAELHLTYEQAAPFKLQWIEAPDRPQSYRVEKMRLNKDKTQLVVNDSLTLAGIPPEAFLYRLGNRSALDWVIDQYQVTTDKRSGITSDPNRADDPQYIVRLIGQVIAVSVETVHIVAGLPGQFTA